MTNLKPGDLITFRDPMGSLITLYNANQQFESHWTVDESQENNYIEIPRNSKFTAIFIEYKSFYIKHYTDKQFLFAKIIFQNKLYYAHKNDIIMFEYTAKV